MCREDGGMGVNRRRFAAVCAVLAVSTLTAVPSAAATPARLSLSEPTGTYQVGAVGLHLVDHSRPDPWHAEFERELMVSVYYPTLRAHGHPPMPYMLPGAAAHFDAVTV